MSPIYLPIRIVGISTKYNSCFNLVSLTIYLLLGILCCFGLVCALDICLHLTCSDSPCDRRPCRMRVLCSLWNDARHRSSSRVQVGAEREGRVPRPYANLRRSVGTGVRLVIIPLCVISPPIVRTSYSYGRRLREQNRCLCRDRLVARLLAHHGTPAGRGGGVVGVSRRVPSSE